jgi:hypothetical protein
MSEVKSYSDVTPYGASKIVNVLLVRAGVEGVKVSSQVMYSRAAKGIVESYRDEDGKWWMKGDAFAKWAKRYVDGYVNGTQSRSVTDWDAVADAYAE